MDKYEKKLNILFHVLEFLILFEVVLGVTAYFMMPKDNAGSVAGTAAKGDVASEELPEPLEIIIEADPEERSGENQAEDEVVQRAILLNPAHVEILGDLMQEEDRDGEEQQDPGKNEGTVSEDEVAPSVSDNNWDELYEYASEIRELMIARHADNLAKRGDIYGALEADVMDNIDFYEALLVSSGESEDTADRFYDAYERILSTKEQNESVVEETGNGICSLKEPYRQILEESGVSSDSSISRLAVALSHDERLLLNNDIEALQGSHYIPYEIGLTTRENMMTAAMSLVGKVRYVWGGGHSGASYIKGINPVWEQWERLYPHEPYSTVSGDGAGEVSANGLARVKNEGYRKCIKPSGSWCPIHGRVLGSFHGERIYSLDEYINARSELFESIDLKDPKYREMLSTVDYTDGVNAHVLDGLDCSGYMSWVFNQITDKYRVNTAARYFTDQECFWELPMGSSLLPGDIFAWEKHIVGIVGKVRDGSKAYVTVEETPNVLRFGVAYYSDASEADINFGTKIAEEANSLIGGIDPEAEPPHVYCINSVGRKRVTVYDDEQGIAVEDGTPLSGDRAEEGSGEVYPETEPLTPETPEEESEPVPPAWDVLPESEPAAGESASHIQEESFEEPVEEIIEEIVVEEQPMEAVEEAEPAEAEPVPEVTEEKPKKRSSHVEVVNTTRIAYFKDGFLDEDVPVDESGKLLKNMTAYEVISHTISRLPISFLDGYDTYRGSLWSREKSSVSDNNAMKE